MRYAMLGIGVTGQSVIRFLAKKNIEVVGFDANLDLTFQHPGVEMILGDFSEQDFSDFTHIVLSPGIDPNLACIQHARKNKINITNDLDLFAAATDKPIIGITGTNGKTSVCVLVANLLQAAGFKVALGGNYGVPALDLLAQDPEIYVLEISNFQLHLAQQIKLAVGVCLNLAPDHLDRYPKLEDYYQDKLKIYQLSATKIYNVHNKIKIPENAQEYKLKDASFKVVNAKFKEFNVEIDERKLQLHGIHWQENYLVSLLIVRNFTPITDKVLQELYKFTGVEHRYEKLGRFANMLWINDSKATNIAATCAALQATVGDIILMLGGVLKEYDFATLKALIKAQEVKLLVCFGKDKSTIAKNLEGITRILIVENLDKAVAAVLQHKIADATVLFSPIAASFDMYKDYKERGVVFKQLVRDLADAGS